MPKLKLSLLALSALMAFTLISSADDTPPKPAPTQGTNSPALSTNAAATKPGPGIANRPNKQGDVASTTAKFGVVSKTDEIYKSALDAHALDDAMKLVDKEGAFKGTVARVFEPRGLAIVEFDQNYKSALTAIVRGSNFTDFPPLTNLIGKDVLVTGKFIKFRAAAEVVLEKPEQIKLAD